MLSYKTKIGLVPIRRDTTPRTGIFNWEKAETRGKNAVEYIEEHFSSENVSFLSLAGITPREILATPEDARRVIEKFRQEQVDAIVFINGNFGCEESAAEVAKALGKPVLIWAPLDDAFEPNGDRWTDSQCGLFAVSRQLQRRGVPFSYIETCRVDEAPFAEGLRRFISVSCMVKNFIGLRIAQIGLRPRPFCSVMFNDSELLEKFDIQILPVNGAVFLNKYNEILQNEDALLAQGAQMILSRYQSEDLTEEIARRIYAFVPVYQWIMKEYDADVICGECWSMTLPGMGIMPCIAYSILADMGYLISCESDLHGVITMALLSSAALGQTPAFFGEFTVRGIEDRNRELIWHCGPFAYSLKKEGAQAYSKDQKQWFPVRDGHYTVARFDQQCGNYQLLIGEFDTAEGPYTTGTYLWAKFDDLAKWERKLIEGPYVHHCAEITGSYAKAVEEFCKFIPGLSADPVE